MMLGSPVPKNTEDQKPHGARVPSSKHFWLELSINCSSLHKGLGFGEGLGGSSRKQKPLEISGVISYKEVVQTLLETPSASTSPK